MSSDYPSWFFARDDSGSDAAFYRQPRFVTHIDDTAIQVVSELYTELGVDRH